MKLEPPSEEERPPASGVKVYGYDPEDPNDSPRFGYILVDDLPTEEMRQSLLNHCYGRACPLMKDGRQGIFVRDYTEWTFRWNRQQAINKSQGIERTED